MKRTLFDSYGGSDAGDYLFNVVLAEELAKVSATLASSLTIHTDVVAPYLVELTSESRPVKHFLAELSVPFPS